MQSTSYWWSGPICGLGNRIIAIAAVKACVNHHAIYFPWSIDPSCPGAYEDIFKPTPNLTPRIYQPAECRVIDTHGWEPLDIYEQFNETLNLGLSLSEFCANFVYELRHLHFQDELVSTATKWRQSIGEASLLGVHIRRTDRTLHHRDQFRAFARGQQGLNRELPLYLSAMYGLLPPPFMRFYEDKALCHSLRQYKNTTQNFGYAAFSDDSQAVAGFEKAVASMGVDNERYRKKSPGINEIPEWNENYLRKTTIQESVIDLLCLSECDAIAQNNRASTFSVIASIIGAKPIITATPRYPFWRVIEQSTLMAPNNPLLIGRRRI